MVTPNNKTPMKSLFALVLILLASLATATAATQPLSVKAERSVFTTGTNQTPVVVVSWTPRKAFDVPAQSYEIQRKLFLFGWRNSGTVSRDGQVWFDRHPSKRASWYRVRIVFDGAKSEWSNKAYVDKFN